MRECKFEYITRLGNHEYLSVATGAELVDLWEQGLLTYNPMIQRGSKIKVRNNEEVEEPVYSKENVKRIYKAMIEDNFYVDMITVNLLSGINDSITDDDGTGKMKLVGQVDILDGQHRIRALQMIKESNAAGYTNINLADYLFPVKITNYDTTKA